MDRVLILHYHEIWLKGGNKNYFLSRLRGAVKQSVADLPMRSLESVAERLVLTPGEEAAIPVLRERLRRVFGLAYVADARQVANSPDEIGRAACALMAEKSPRSFAVRAKIADTAFGWHSMQLEREVGRVVLDHLRASDPSVQVNLSQPEVTCWVEVVPGRAFLYADRVDGAGGLPPVTGGRLVALLSGGFDSAVAAYKMMRRGCHLTFVHFFANPSPARNSSRGVAEEIVRVLTPYQFTSRLYLIPFDAVQRQIVAGAHESYRVLLYRRMMARIAREIARGERAMGLVTGDSVSQVASQTLHNLAAIDRGLDLPVYRPLAGDDKAEILRWARQIGTYKISCEPFEDCCPRFMPRSPALFARHQELEKAEGGLDIEGLVQMGLEAATALEFKFQRGVITASEGLPRQFEKLRSRRKAAHPQAATPSPGPA
jgi:tRNA uracil 4-sulfurtransferase